MQPSPPNLQRARRRHQGMGDVGCWVLGVFRFLFIACLGEGFAVYLFASEPSFFTATHAVAGGETAAAAKPEAPAAPQLRPLAETELLQLLTATLQQETVKDRGELELRLPNPWASRKVPEGPLTVKILDLPPTGIAASFIMRFELRSERESLGIWQVAAQARVWREIWVAKSPLKRGEILADADIVRERRDVLALRESLADFTADDTNLILSEPLQSGAPLLARSVRLRPVIRRGQTADALVQDGVLSISMKVEALEDGVPGQIIRARNSQSRRDLRGKVLNEQTILISL